MSELQELQESQESPKTVKCKYCRKLVNHSDFIHPSNQNKIYKTCVLCRTSALKFYKNNREKILERIKNEEETCECGCKYNPITRHGHLQSKNHIEFIKTKLNLETKDEAKEEIKKEDEKRKRDR